MYLYVDTLYSFIWVAWRSEGCTTKEISDTNVICSCNHLTNFGLLAVSVKINFSVLMYMIKANKTLILVTLIIICYIFNRL